MRQSRLSGSAEGVMGNHDPYSDNTHVQIGQQFQRQKNFSPSTLLLVLYSP
jgi:hypothetical protein